MNKDNPACYECLKGKNALHTWRRVKDGTAVCLKCGLKLTRAQAQDAWNDRG